MKGSATHAPEPYINYMFTDKLPANQLAVLSLLTVYTTIQSEVGRGFQWWHSALVLQQLKLIKNKTSQTIKNFKQQQYEKNTKKKKAALYSL